ncbi:MAG: transposase, partial [Symploca sp. SIO3C6]|nr:transposase [Symploca sp. SIO3C6]
MAHPYSQDLRLRTLYLITSGMSISKVSRTLDISKTTLYKWRHQLESIGSTLPMSSPPPPQPSQIKDLNKFQKFVDA